VAATSAQFCQPGRQRQVDLCLQVVKLQLQPSEPRADITRDLLAKVTDADCATCQHPKKHCHEQDHRHHRLCQASGPSLLVCITPPSISK